MAKPRSSIAELERLLRVTEPSSNNLGQYLAEAGEELAARLGVGAEKLAALVALPDEKIAPLLEQLLEHRASERTAAHQADVRAVAMSAAQQLGATAVWTNDVAAIAVGLLLGELLLDTSKSYILFDAHGLCVEFQVSLPRSLLVNVAKEIGRRPDLIAGIDEQGLHLRWNRGRGGFNFISQSVPASEAMNVLYVNIPPPVVRSQRVPVRGGWFAEVLSEVALA
jgi:hypothetical protein